jgi:hypothetical protein
MRSKFGMVLQDDALSDSLPVRQSHIRMDEGPRRACRRDARDRGGGGNSGACRREEGDCIWQLPNGFVSTFLLILQPNLVIGGDVQTSDAVLASAAPRWTEKGRCLATAAFLIDG